MINYVSQHVAPCRASAVVVVAFVVAFVCDQQGPGITTPGLRPAHTAGVVTADRWVDDLESERWATTRGFESLRFRPSTSTNTDVLITY